MLTGGCYCKAVRYQASGPTFNQALCHCDMCRGTTGAPCVAWFSVARKDFRFLSGTPTRFHSSDHGTRTFCPRCGTQLTFQDSASPDEIDVATCSLDDISAQAPLSHIFTGSAAPWLHLTDDLPRYTKSRADG